ncbi:MAG: TonB-dependent receptor [Prevotellaceae bacterium]|jgi:iron complex outermembrane receptor protein|nr:TonB-dependent receptor [Prevotellaceae bacterium]
MRTFLLIILCVHAGAAASYAQEADSVRQTVSLDEVTVTGNTAAAKRQLQPLTVLHTEKEYMQENRSNSLMNTLEKLPGIHAFQVGQGFSKPVIRGLGFNRLVVAENGIKQQEQQWGADHGLEIDQYAVEQVEIVKGPASLQYGSDAIAGVVIVHSHAWLPHDGVSGSLLLNGHSNNRLFGGSGDIYYQKKNKFMQARATCQNFESYRLPAKTFIYNGYEYPLHHGILKNTAGREMDASWQAGWRTAKYAATLHVNNIHSKDGFFAGASGLPFLVNMDDEGHYRAINLPYHESNHFKAVFNQNIYFNNRHKLTVDAGYQYNLRQEYSVPHTHGFGPTPEGNLELELRLQTASLNAVWEYRNEANNTLQAGVNAEYQHNRIGGYLFLLPEFEQQAAGAFMIGRFHFSGALTGTAGVRYDYGSIRIHRYDGYFRVAGMRKPADDMSFMAGLAYRPDEQWELKANIGKSFRMPVANEYASNGISHVMLRYEIGDSSLRAETSYQCDVHAAFQKTWSGGFIHRAAAAASVFGNYFPNFIFLNPTGEFSPLPEAGQIYRYAQSQAFRAGGELEAQVEFADIFRLYTTAEYVQATDMESGFPIAFTPPLNIASEMSVRWKQLFFLTNNRLAVTHRYAAAQNRVARNEAATPDYHLFDISLTAGIPAGRTAAVQLILQVQNLFNTAYYKHLSFYRRLSLPETGRNFLITIQILFNNQF